MWCCCIFCVDGPGGPASPAGAAPYAVTAPGYVAATCNMGQSINLSSPLQNIEIRNYKNFSVLHFCSDETHLHWFHASSMDLDTEFELIGILIGLAIYNGHILEFQFPLVLYKKLMGQAVGLEDLRELQPEVYSSLNKLMSMKEEELQSMALTFQVGWCSCMIYTTVLLPSHHGLLQLSRASILQTACTSGPAGSHSLCSLVVANFSTYTSSRLW